MPITALALEALPCAVGEPSVEALLEAADRVLDVLTARDLGGLSEGQALGLVRWATSAMSRLAAVRLAGVAVVDRRGAARRVGATSTAAWLKAEGAGGRAARRDVDLAEALAEPEHLKTREGLALGRFSPEHAEVVTEFTDALSDAVLPQQRAAFEAELLQQAEMMDPFQLRTAAKRAAARVDPLGSGDLERQERAAKTRGELVIFKGRDGMYVLRGQLDVRAAATVSGALDPLAAPRASSVDGPDLRSPGRRLADALVELARRALADGGLPDTGGLRPEVVVTMTLDQLRAGDDETGPAGCAQITGGTVREPISAGAARRIACDAGIIPAVLGGRSQILDYGHTRRTASPGQRKALALRDGGCTARGCDRPPSWCEAHHLIPWSILPRTDLNNLALVCDAHHDLLHHDGWSIALSEDGKAIWTPPPQPPPEEPPPEPEW